MKSLKMTIILADAYTSGEECTSPDIPYEFIRRYVICISVEDDPFAINQGWDELAKAAREHLKGMDPGGFRG